MSIPGQSVLILDVSQGSRHLLALVCGARAFFVAMKSSQTPPENAGDAHPDAENLSLSALCDLIEREHHGFLRREMPRLDSMTRQAAAAHGDRDPRLHEVRAVFEDFELELAMHTQDEERQVFPAIRRLETASARPPDAATALGKALANLESDHERAGAAIARFAELTDHYTPPAWACGTLRVLCETLARLDADMIEHVRKEDHVLFPKARALAETP